MPGGCGQGDITRRGDEWVLGRTSHQVSNSGFFLLSICLLFSLSPCPPLPPCPVSITLGLVGYLLRGTRAWIRGYREEVS